MYYILQFMEYTIYSRVSYLFTTLTSIHSDSHNFNKFTPTTPTYSLPPQLWHAHFHHLTACLHYSDIFTFQPLICFVSLRWHSHSHLWQSGFAGSKLVAAECSFSPLWQSGFAGSKLLAVDLGSLVAENLASLGAVDLASMGASW